MCCCALICLRSTVRARGIDKVPVLYPCIWCLSGNMSPRTGFPAFVSVIDSTGFVLLGVDG